MLSFLSFSKNLNESANPAFDTHEKMKQLDRDIASGSHSDEHLSKRAEEIHSELGSHLKKVRGSMEDTVKGLVKNRSGVKFKASTKSTSSVVDKAVKRKRGMSNMGDMVRGAVLFNTHDEAHKFVKDLKRKHGDKIVDHEYKEHGSDPEYGYHGIHHIQMMHHGVQTELQVAPKHLWAKKHMAHQIYTGSRSREGGATKQEKTLSKRIFAAGNKPRQIPSKKKVTKLRGSMKRVNIADNVNYDNIIQVQLYEHELPEELVESVRSERKRKEQFRTGSGTHKDKKKADKQGESKYKNKNLDEGTTLSFLEEELIDMDYDSWEDVDLS